MSLGPHVRRSLAKRDGRRCVYCGFKAKRIGQLTIDHVVPTSRGGSNALSNLRLACPKCNHDKGAALLDSPPPMGRPRLG